MADKNKKRDPMPPPDSTPEEIGEFWDTHSLADYWDETHEVEFQVNLKSRQNLSPDETEAADQRDTLSAEQGWRKLKELIQSLDEQHKGRKKGEPFEELVAKLLELLLEIPFVLAKSGTQPSGDARSMTGEVAIQAKNYSNRTDPRDVEIVGDIDIVNENLQDLQVYVLVISRDIPAQLLDKLENKKKNTGLDIVTLELSDELSDLGALCVTYWEDICHFFGLSDTNPEFSDWVQIAKNESQTREKMKDVRKKLEEGIQTQKQIQKDVEKYLLKRFNSAEGFNPINLSQAIGREKESQISDWWGTEGAPICCLEGEEGHGKSWLAAKWINSIREKENIVTFWLDSRDWSGARSIFNLLYTCFDVIYPSYEQRKISKLQNKPAKIWRKTLIILDGVNERNAIEAAQRILAEYFRNDESEWRDRIRFLFTTRPLNDYPDFERYLWSECHKISVDAFNDSELQEALTREGLQLDDLPDSLKDIARIPRYFQRCIELRDELGSFEVVTKEMVLWADLLYKIKYSGDRQIRKKLDWQSIEEAQDDLARLAREAKWTDAPHASVELLRDCFPNYHKIRRDLKEQRIALKAHKRQAELSKDHIVLGWALYLSNLFDCKGFTDIKDFSEAFQNALEPIPSEDLRTEALFVALQITAISPEPNIPRDQLSQKRAALMLAWFDSHNAQITNKRISFWVQTDIDAYAQFVKVQLETHNQSSYEEALIEPLAKAWLHETGQIDQLRLCLTKWFLAPLTDDGSEDIVYVGHKGNQFPREKGDIQAQLSRAAISILSQRPERQFLETLANCYAGLQSGKKSDESNHRFFYFSEHLGRLMRWGYTEAVLEDLRLLAEQAQGDEFLLNGIYGLAANLQVVDLPPLLQRSLSEEDRELYARAAEFRRNFKSAFDRVSNQEQLLTGESPEANVKGNYHGLDYLAVRTDLPNLCSEDMVEIKKLLHYISANAQLGRSRSASLEGFCIENLIPWVAKYAPEDYSAFACSFKINALNPECLPYVLLATQGLIFQQDDCEKITEAILKTRQYLAQEDDSSLERARLLTETLLFCAPEEKLTDWFKFLAAHEPLRISICYEPLPDLLRKLLPETIVKLAQQKLETLWSSSSDNQIADDGKSKEFSEEEFWCTLYAYGAPVDENTINYALKALKIREPNSIGTFPMLWLALSGPNQFLAETLTDKEIRRHLFSRHGKRFIIPIYEGENIPSYDVLMSLLPPRIVGYFLCSPDRCSDLSQWGKEIIEWIFSNLQGIQVDFDYNSAIRFSVNPKVLRTWAEQNTTDFLQLSDEYLTQLSKFPQYSQALSGFTDAIRCLLLRFQPDKAKQYYYQWNAESFKTVYSTSYGVETTLAQLWQIEECRFPEHLELRRKLLEECLNDEKIMLMTLAALAGGGEKELWGLLTEEYLASPYAKERNLGISILPWFGNDKAIEKLEQLKSDDPSQWVRGYAWWAYEVAQQERSCREVYREALKTRDLFRISAVFEQIKPALSPTARWWHREIEKEEGFHEESQEIDSRLDALHYRFWYRWGNSTETKRNIKVFGRKLSDYCRGEKLSAGSTPRIAPWWKPTSD